MKRRTFCAAGVAATGLALSPSLQAAGANDRIRLGLIGCGSRMNSHLNGFAKRDDCQIVAVCDVEESRAAEAAEKIQTITSQKPQQFSELRKVIDDQSTDAIVISTPDHWHCLAAIWACQAGKDVYVEKPVSHNV